MPTGIAGCRRRSGWRIGHARATGALAVNVGTSPRRGRGVGSRPLSAVGRRLVPAMEVWRRRSSLRRPRRSRRPPARSCRRRVVWTLPVRRVSPPDPQRVAGEIRGDAVDATGAWIAAGCGGVVASIRERVHIHPPTPESRINAAAAASHVRVPRPRSSTTATSFSTVEASSVGSLRTDRVGTSNGSRIGMSTVSTARRHQGDAVDARSRSWRGSTGGPNLRGQRLDRLVVRVEVCSLLDRLERRIEDAFVECGAGAEHTPLDAPAAHAEFEALPLIGRGVRLSHVCGLARIALDRDDPETTTAQLRAVVAGACENRRSVSLLKRTHSP